MKEEENTVESVAVPIDRLILGGFVFVLGFLSPLFIPLVIGSDLSAGFKSLISGILAFGIPEIFMLMAVAILGKAGFSYLKSKIFGWFKKYGPPDTVSLTRYRIGLIFFIVPILIGFVLPYVWELVPFIKQYLLFIVISGDVILLISLFILGGDFWDKLRSLFVYNSRVELINDRTQKTIQHD